MTEGRAAGLARLREWSRLYARDTFCSADFYLAVCAGAATTVLLYVHDGQVGEDREVAILLGTAALGVALLAVVLTAMAILGGITPQYRAILSRGKRGVAGAFMPYRTVAVVSGLLTLSSLGGLVLSGVGNRLTAALGGGMIALLTVWATWGTVQLTELTAMHARFQARLEQDPTPEELEAHRKAMRSQAG